MTDYITSAALKSTLTLSNQSFADADIAAAITAASRGIDNVCNRHFSVDTNDQTRYYTPQLLNTVVIDDLVSFTSLDTDQTGDGSFGYSWILNTDFVLAPINAAADGEPYTRLVAHPRHRLTFGFPSYYPRSVKLVGKFGWPAVPAPITEATTILASMLLKRAREAPFGVVAIGMDVGAAVRIAQTDPTVKFLIANYMREKPITA